MTPFDWTSTVQEKPANGKLTVGSENSLFRWEFLEALVRIAIAKYGKGTATSSPTEAIEMLLKQHLEDKVAPAARVDLNWFRTNHLYCEPVDELFKKHEAILRALYSRWRLRPPSGGLRTKVLNLLAAMMLVVWLHAAQYWSSVHTISSLSSCNLFYH